MTIFMQNKNSIIADSSGLISLVSSTDQNHQKALDISQELLQAKGSIIIPSDVFSETLNVAGKKLGHSAAVGTAETLFTTSPFVIVDSDEKLREHAFSLFKKQPEPVSFTDCIVMATADRYKTKEIFGFDKIFSKNGYNRIGLD